MSVNTKPRHKRPAPSHTRQGMALAVTTVVSAGVVIGGAGAAGAATNPVSQSRGFFLSGSALGVNLDQIVKLQDARAVNTGSPAVVTQLNPLSATVLNSLTVPIGPLNLLGNNGFLTLGAVNQAAIARSNGSAIGASGAVSDSGAIAVNGQSNVPASNATLDLGNVLGSTAGAGLVAGLVDADLTVGAISANATQTKCPNGSQVGDYRIEDLVLDVRSPLLAGVLGTLGLGNVQTTLDTLAAAISTLVPGATLTGTNGLTPDTTLSDGAVSIDLTTGSIHVDVEKLLQSLGLDLNNLPPNTEIVGLIVDAISSRVVGLVDAELQRLVDNITGIGLGGTAIPALLQAQIDTLVNTAKTTLLAPFTSTQNSLVSGGLLDPAFSALEKLLSIRVNVQERSGGMFTERAVQIRVLPDSGAVNDTLATVNLASASVGPGQCKVVTPPRTPPTEPPTGPQLPHTGAGESAPLAAAGIALMLAGAAATAGAGRMGTSSAAAHAGARGRGNGGGGRHRR
ncbi:MAG TPA: choice-of-anchor G family protein [Sporichthya sp.]|nr:choice-of-anchor G family protein [Sporichthya sp.]